MFVFQLSFVSADENRERRTSSVPECGCRSSGHYQNTTVRPSRVLDRYNVICGYLMVMNYKYIFFFCVCVCYTCQDPLLMVPQKALEMIGSSLQKQYERWQPRARYKQSLDPTIEEVKKLCISLRRNAKEERVLFHYNGHGVPKPTANGEIWVFNRVCRYLLSLHYVCNYLLYINYLNFQAYTQYIPLSIYDLQSWMGSPSIYVYDCSNAGMIVKLFNQFAEQHEKEILVN